LGLALFQQEIDSNRRLNGNTKILWFIHDNIMFLAKNRVFDYATRMLQECVEVRTKEYIHKHFKVDVDYPITSTGKRGHSWADLA